MGAVHRAIRRVLGKRGWLSSGGEAEFEDLGLERPALYEIVVLVGIKTISNYVTHIAGTEVDEPFQQSFRRLSETTVP